MEHLDVIVVGAGLSGVAAGRYVEDRCPWASFVILEARDDVGGTWDLFRYPGVRSDSDMHTLGYSFRPWDSATVIADGPSILRYIKDTVAEQELEKRIRFGHRVVRAEWSAAEARWHVTARVAGSEEEVELTCGFLLSCTGYYRYDHGHRPEFAGMDTFGGTVVHPQEWPADLDVTGKRVVVIGSGATAVTLAPALAASAAQVTMLQRSPSYIAAGPDRDPVAVLLRRILGPRVAGELVRWFHALAIHGFYQFSRRHPDVVKRIVRAGLRRRLPRGYDIDTHFTPRYDPWDERFCFAPNGDLFKAISDGRVTMVTDVVDRFTSTGIRLVSGLELEADVVVTATGLELEFMGGIEVVVDGAPVTMAGRLTYKGFMLEDVPNLAFAVGYTNASWTLKCELTFDYVCRVLAHLRATGTRVCTPVNDDSSVTGTPIMTLQSGYIRRSAHLLPHQGSRMPWQVHQSYLRDYVATKLARIPDEGLVFSS